MQSGAEPRHAKPPSSRGDAEPEAVALGKADENPEHSQCGTHFVPGTFLVCPGDIPGVSQEQPDQKVYVCVPFSRLNYPDPSILVFVVFLVFFGHF